MLVLVLVDCDLNLNYLGECECFVLFCDENVFCDINISKVWDYEKGFFFL